MKNHARNALIALLALMFILSILPVTHFVKAASPSINLPPGTVSATYDYPGSNSYWTITLSNVPSGYDVTNGVYTGWCNDETHYINNGETLNGVTLYSSYAQTVYPGDWYRVNYIINHPQGSWEDVQDAIWYYIDGHNMPSSAAGQAMVNDANANGGSFEPAPGQLLAVVVWDAGYQTTFIAVTVPVQLTVVSAYGSPNPSGTTTYANGTTITASVTSPASGPDGSEYACTGWTGTGDVPASGTETSVTFTITQDSSITWNWQIQWVPMLWVDIDPASTTVWGPTTVGSTFTVDVRLWNDKSLTGYDVYAYDFNLTWDTSLAFISLVGVSVHVPFSSYFIIANDTTPNYAQPIGNYHLAVTATGANNGLNVVDNVSLVTLTFQITAEPSWPFNFSTTFNIVLNGMSGDGTVPVPIRFCELDPGTYTLEEPQPDVCISSPNQLGPITSTVQGFQGDYYVTERAVGVTHEVDVYLSNVTNCYGFYVQLDYNASYKTTDVQQITIDSVNFPPPYDFLNMYVGTGQLEVLLVRPWEKPTVCGANVLAFSVVFTSTAPEATSTPYPGLPTPFNSTIDVSSAFILSQCPWNTTLAFEYDQSYTPCFYNSTLYGTGEGGIVPTTIQDYPLLCSCPLVNWWNPKLADLNLDGVVDIQDLAALAQVYGQAVPWAGLVTAAEGGTSVVNIFDFVYIAKNFGDP